MGNYKRKAAVAAAVAVKIFIHFFVNIL